MSSLVVDSESYKTAQSGGESPSPQLQQDSDDYTIQRTRVQATFFPPPDPTRHHEFAFSVSRCCYYAYVDEICPDTLRPHCHVYAEFKGQLSLKWIKKLFTKHTGQNPHIEICVGTRLQNLGYLSKSAPVSLVKETPNLPSFLHLFEVPLEQALQIDPSYFARSATQFFAIKKQLPLARGSPSMQIKKFIYWYYGLTGTGKSFLARSQMERLYSDLHLSFAQLPVQQNGSFWFDGYTNERVFLIEELRGNITQLSNLLQILDLYPVQVPVKGSFVMFAPEYIFITAPCSPQEMFFNVSNDKVDQLIRRLHVIAHFEYSPLLGYTIMNEKGN
jgi:hypothetical protein